MTILVLRLNSRVVKLAKRTSGEHHYFFKVYALDTDLGLSSDAKKEDLEKAMEDHILDKAELVGLYSKE